MLQLTLRLRAASRKFREFMVTGTRMEVRNWQDLTVARQVTGPSLTSAVTYQTTPCHIKAVKNLLEGVFVPPPKSPVPPRQEPVNSLISSYRSVQTLNIVTKYGSLSTVSA